MPKIINLIGQKFGRLKVINFYQTNKNGKRCWLCLCDCGQKRTIIGSNLLNGNTRSCGCFQIEKVTGKQNPLWKGDELGYDALHDWLHLHFGYPPICENCGKIGSRINGLWTIQWAKLKGKKYIRKRKYFWGLCVRCHHLYDYNESESGIGLGTINPSKLDFSVK